MLPQSFYSRHTTTTPGGIQGRVRLRFLEYDRHFRHDSHSKLHISAWLDTRASLQASARSFFLISTLTSPLVSSLHRHGKHPVCGRGGDDWIGGYPFTPSWVRVSERARERERVRRGSGPFITILPCFSARGCSQRCAYSTLMGGAVFCTWDGSEGDKERSRLRASFLVLPNQS